MDGQACAAPRHVVLVVARSRGLELAAQAAAAAEQRGELHARGPVQHIGQVVQVLIHAGLIGDQAHLFTLQQVHPVGEERLIAQADHRLGRVDKFLVGGGVVGPHQILVPDGQVILHLVVHPRHHLGRLVQNLFLSRAHGEGVHSLPHPGAAGPLVHRGGHVEMVVPRPAVHGPERQEEGRLHLHR